MINILTRSFYVRKCSGAQLLFHEPFLGVTYASWQAKSVIFCAIRSTPCASKIGVNLMAQKLPIKCCWNWAHQYRTLEKPKIHGQPTIFKLFCVSFNPLRDWIEILGSFLGIFCFSYQIFECKMPSAKKFGGPPKKPSWPPTMGCETLL